MPVDNVRQFPVASERKQDPQYVLFATIKASRKSDSEVITYSKWLSNGLTEEVHIVPMPDEGKNGVSVFVKVKSYDSPPPRYYEHLRRQLEYQQRANHGDDGDDSPVRND